MKRVAAAGVSLAAIVAAFLGLRLWLHQAGRDTLGARLTGDRVLAGVARLDRTRGPAGRWVVDGVARSGEGPLPLDPEALGPGLHLAGLEVDYLGRPPRRVGFGLLAGPFDPEPAPVGCGVRVAISQSLLDRLAARLEGPLAEALAARGMPRPRRTRLRLAAAPPGLVVQVHLGFEGESALAARIPFTVSAGAASALTLRRQGEVEAVVEGPLATWAAILGGGLLDALESLITHPGRGVQGALDEAREAAREKVAREVGEAVDRFAPQLERRLGELVPATLTLTLGRVEASLALTACGSARVRPGEVLALRFDALPRVEVAPPPPPRPGLQVRRRPPRGPSAPPPALAAPPPAPPPLRAAVPGVVRRPEAPLPALPGPLAGDLGVALAPGLVARALEAAWQAGALDLLLEAEAVRAPVEARLSLAGGGSLGEVGLALPPGLSVEGEELVLRVGEVTAGLQGAGRTRWLLLSGELRARADLPGPGLVLTPGPVWAACAATPGGPHREACYQELAAGLERMGEAGGPLALTLAPAYPLGNTVLRPRRLTVTPEALELTCDLELEAGSGEPGGGSGGG